MDKFPEHPLLKLLPLHRVLISLAIAAVAYFILRAYDLKPLVTALGVWIGFAFSYLLVDWIIIFKRTVEQIRQRAKLDDGSAVFVFFIVLLASFASMVAVLLLTVSKEKSDMLTLGASIAAMLLSWVMVHTQYVFHYAHEYYDEDGGGDNKHEEGLKFPEDDEPEYLDFAYFSFCIGTTFQVSDVEVTTKQLRRIVLVHGLIAFFMNTFVVALTINMIAGLTSG